MTNHPPSTVSESETYTCRYASISASVYKRIQSYASNRIKVVCLWPQGVIVHTSLTVWHACDITLAIPEVINISSSQLVNGDWIASIMYMY